MMRLTQINRNWQTLLVSSLTIVVISGCSNSGEQNEFFETLTTNSEQALSNLIKNTPDDSLEHYIPYFVTLYPDYMKPTGNSRKWPDFLDSNFVAENVPEMDRILLLAFKRHLNNESIVFNDVKMKVDTIIESQNRADALQERMDSTRLVDIITSNNEVVLVGDTISLSFDLQRLGNRYSVTLHPYPFSEEMSLSDDTLFMNAIVLDKRYDRNASGYANDSLNHPFNQLFDLLVIGQSHKDVWFFDRKR
ncbi:MAG: hypothetical protein JJ975_17505 [Bacteroidia bacterium]|nr:hypothetical protein [Bacteroidia bacterium]